MKIRQIIDTFGVIIRNFILGSNIISLSMLLNPRKMIRYVSESLFLYRQFCHHSGISQKNVFEVLPANTSETINLGNLRGDETWFVNISSYASDIVSLCLICKIIKPKIIFEIGTLRGYTALQFALNTDDDVKIYTLDLPSNHDVSSSILETTIMDDAHIKASLNGKNYIFEGTDVSHKIICLFGDSAIFEFSPFYEKIDLFFIDGAHSYEYVRSDTLNALKCCHNGSVIAWHDFGRVGVNGVTKWLLELSKQHKIYSIPGGSLSFMIVE
jgi:predicted O-methyltransferase YrrM